MDRLPNIHKIAVLRATGLGDYLAATPALRGLRDAYPDAEIVYLGRTWHQEFLTGRPGPVDRALVIPVSHGVRIEPFRPEYQEEDPAELDRFFAAMQQERFDLGIQMHGGGRNSNPFVLRLGAPVNIGMRTPDAPLMDRWIPYLFYQHEIMRTLELVRLIGAEPCSVSPSLELTERDYADLRAALPDLPRPYIVIHPGANDVKRRWPAERFAQVADRLAQEGYEIIVTGDELERALVGAVVGGMQHPAINAFGKLSVGGLAALLAGASLVVANDTGPMHLANALDVPNVAIFWAGNYMNWAHFGRSRHRPLASWITHCPLCGGDMTRSTPPATDCDHQVCFVAGVTVEEVLAAAFDLLAYPAPPR